MTEALRRRINSLCAAYAEGNFEIVQNCLDEDVDFISYAPVEIFPCLGKQQGRGAVLSSLKAIHGHFAFLAYDPIFLLVQDEDAALNVMARLKQRATGRIVRIIFAQFFRFRDARIVEFREFMDSFDAVEQVLGRHIRVIGNGFAKQEARARVDDAGDGATGC
jgi:ketosteroid isomerase-like protein